MSQIKSRSGCFNIFLLLFLFLSIKNIADGNYFIGVLFLFSVIWIIYNLYQMNKRTREEKQKEKEKEKAFQFGKDDISTAPALDSEVITSIESLLVNTDNNKKDSYSDDDSEDSYFASRSVSVQADYFFRQTNYLLSVENITSLHNHFNNAHVALNDLVGLSASDTNYDFEVRRAFDKKKFKNDCILEIALSPNNEQALKDLYVDRLYQIFNSVYEMELEIIKENPKRKTEIIKALLAYSDAVRAELKLCGKNDKVYEYLDGLTDKRQELYALKLSFD